MSNQLGKLPPQVLELEESVLGALMIESDALNKVIDVLRPETFYKVAHQEIYQAIFELFSESEPIDMLTVSQQLRKKSKLELAGGPTYIMRLTTSVNSAANIEYHARIITEQAIKRELISIASEIHKEAFEDSTDVFELLDSAEQKLFQISESNIRKNFSMMSPLVQRAIKEIESRKDLKDGLTGIPTGLTALDRLTAGWQKSDLVILAARPGMGKTAFSLSVVRNAAVDFGHPVAFFSLEMSEMQLVNRLISAEAELESDKIKRGNLAEHEWTQLYHKTSKISEAPIFIDDTPGLSVLELRAKCRRLKAQHDIQLIIVDYLQLMTANVGKGGQGNREQEIALISRSLKNIAKELNVPVIALSQLSRAVETRGGDKRPQLSDLRESGCITGDSLILNSETGELIPIKELAERQTQTPFACAAVDGQLKVNNHSLVKAFYSGKKQVFELVTRTGRKIKASANHPFLKLGGWTRLDALNVGDTIAVPRRINITKPSNPLSDDELILLGNSSYDDDKKLPKAIFKCDTGKIALFITHLWATDGNISWKRSEGRKESAAIYCASSSRLLCEQVQHLLLRLDILSTILTKKSNKDYRDMYHLKIDEADNQIKFLEKVGCYGERGEIIPDLLKALYQISSNPNYDVIPQEAWDLVIKPLKETQKISWREFASQLGVAYNGAGLFKHGVSRTRMQNISQVLPFALINHLANSDVLWDEIIAINPLGEEDVYDATVSEVHNFVANDIILHNSIEQDADIVLFLYRPEYYGITQDLEGAPTKDVGEVIIAKHRNGSLGDVKLKFIGKYTKFTNLENEGFNFGGDTSKGVITLSSKVNERPSNPPDTSSLPPTDEPPF